MTAFLGSEGLGAAFFFAAAGLAFLAAAAAGFLASAATGLRTRTIAGAKQMAADRRTERVCVDVIWDLSNAKAMPGSRGLRRR
jgi:pyrroline-5-carboxylate reductase